MEEEARMKGGNEEIKNMKQKKKSLGGNRVVRHKE